MTPLQFGDVTVQRLVEAEGPGFFPGFLIPDSDEQVLAAERDWLLPHFHDPGSGRLVMSVHSYVVRTPKHTILIDTCVGNDKNRPSTKPWHQLQTPWLDDLRAMGVSPEEVDYVMCTHLHVDHVGWNTRLVDGRWVPTFPNAKYLFHKDEYAHWQAVEEAPQDGQGSGGSDGCFTDSVLPVMEAGQAILVDNGHSLDDTFWLDDTRGHSPGHVAIRMQAGGREAVFSGDLMHHPIQAMYPEWNSRFCHDPELSRATRRRFVDHHAERDVTVLAAHFAAPTAGRIVAASDRCRFQV